MKEYHRATLNALPDFETVLDWANRHGFGYVGCRDEYTVFDADVLAQNLQASSFSAIAGYGRSMGHQAEHKYPAGVIRRIQNYIMQMDGGIWCHGVTFNDVAESVRVALADKARSDAEFRVRREEEKREQERVQAERAHAHKVMVDALYKGVKFKQAPVDVRVGVGGNVDASASVLKGWHTGCFAVHVAIGTDKNVYSVTHKPTGFMVAGDMTLRDAKVVAARFSVLEGMDKVTVKNANEHKEMRALALAVRQGGAYAVVGA